MNESVRPHDRAVWSWLAMLGILFGCLVAFAPSADAEAQMTSVTVTPQVITQNSGNRFTLNVTESAPASVSAYRLSGLPDANWIVRNGATQLVPVSTNPIVYSLPASATQSSQITIAPPASYTGTLSNVVITREATDSPNLITQFNGGTFDYIGTARPQLEAGTTAYGYDNPTTIVAQASCSNPQYGPCDGQYTIWPTATLHGIAYHYNNRWADLRSVTNPLSTAITAFPSTTVCNNVATADAYFFNGTSLYFNTATVTDTLSSNAGKFLIVNGSTSGDRRVVYTTITGLQPNTYYSLTGSLANLSLDAGAASARAQFFVSTGGTDTLIGTSQPLTRQTGCTQPLSVGWGSTTGVVNTGSSTSLTVGVRTDETAQFGNDFGIDNLVFRALSSASLSLTVEPGRITFVKDVQSRFATADQFTVSASGPGATGTLTSTGTTAGTDTGAQTNTGEFAALSGIVPGQSYTLTETDASGANLANYSATWSCADTAGTAYALTGTGTSRTLVYPTTTVAGNHITCTLSNRASPSVALEKYVDARLNAADQFVLTLGSNPSQTTTGTANGRQSVSIGPVATAAGATIAFSEQVTGSSPAGSYTSTWACTRTPIAGGASTSLGQGTGTSGSVTIPTNIGSDRVVCAFTNRPYGSVVWNKIDSVTGNPLGGATFVLTGPTGTQQTVVDNVGQSGYTGRDINPAPGVFEVGGLAWGAYSIKESAAPPGYQLSSNPPQIALPPITATTLRSVLATPVGNDPLPHLTLRKIIVNDNGGTATANDFTLSATGQQTITGVSGQASVTNAQVAPGSYVIGETAAVDGYLLTDLQCVRPAGVPGGDPVFDAATRTLTLDPGDVAVCTFTNNDQEAKLTLAKTVRNTHTGTATAADFPLTATSAGGTVVATGVAGSSAVTAVSLNAGVYVLSEEQLDGYVLSSLVCRDSNGDELPAAVFADGSLTLHNGVSATCTFTNDDVPVLEMPFAGGNGRAPFLAAGTALLLIGGLFGARSLRRRRRFVPTASPTHTS